jgi:hypothetical protein
MSPNILMPIMIFMIKYYNSSRSAHRIVSVSQHFFKIIRLSLFALIVVVSSSCEKQVLKLGQDILPGTDFVSIKSIDTLSVFSYLMFDDSIRTDNPATSYLGQIYDPYFGTTNAGFVTQIRLNQRWDGQPYTVDSIKLYLHLLTATGSGAGTAHSISLYEISDQIYNDSAYYSNTPLNLTNFKVAGIKLPVLRTDTINDVTLTLPGNGIEFGNYLIHDTTKLFYSNTVADFRSYFKGLYFEMDPSSSPLIVSLNLVYNLSTIYNFFIMYGHDADGVEKQYSFNLDAISNNAAYNRYSHDYNTATLGNKMAYRNTTYRDTLSYLQSLNGVYTKISLPGLEKLKNDASFGNMAINRARLSVPLKFTKTSSNFYKNSVPLRLRLRYKVKNGGRYDVPDYTMAEATSDPTHNFFDGTLDSVANVYNFNIPSFVQSYLKDATGNVKPEVEIFQTSGILNAVFGANTGKTPVKFEFTYTKF